VSETSSGRCSSNDSTLVVSTDTCNPLVSATHHPRDESRGRKRDITAGAVYKRLVADGRPEALFAGPWGTVSAQTHLSLDRVGFDQFGVWTPAPNLGRVRCPVLALAGTEEGQVATPDDLEAIRRHAVAAPRVELHVVAGADHFHTGHEAEVAARVAGWAAGLIQRSVVRATARRRPPT
jgi:hypothetical protein